MKHNFHKSEIKPYATYGTKPRGSKTSKKEILNGIPVFMHYSKSSTAGNIIVYWMKEPYPRIVTAVGHSYWECREKVDEFFSKYSLDIKSKLENLDRNLGIPKDIMDKMLKPKSYDISETQKKGYSLVCKHIGNNEYKYLYVNMKECPTLNSKGKKVVDTDKVYEEYLKRKEEDERHIRRAEEIQR